MKRPIFVVAVAAAACSYPVMYETRPVTWKSEYTAAQVAHGKQIVSLLCADCHFDQKTGGLSGKRMAETPPEFGVLYSANITAHPTRGIGAWSDSELVYLLRTGVAKDGRFPGPFMAHPRMSDDDLASIVAFLRSPDPLVTPRDLPSGTTEPSFLFRMLSHVAFKPTDFPTGPIAAPDPKDRVAYGRYLMDDLYDCYGCHSSTFKKMDVVHPDKTPGYYGGGNELRDAEGEKVLSANLTFDKETGIGTWTEAQFVRAVREGIRPDNKPLRYPMEWMPQLSADEAGAMYAYLQTVPVLQNPLDRFKERPAPGGSSSAGKTAFYKYGCSTCHGATGIGICDLRDAYTKFKTREGVIEFLHDPSKIVPDSRMPTWQGVVAESDYGPLADFVKELADAAPTPAP